MAGSRRPLAPDFAKRVGLAKWPRRKLLRLSPFGPNRRRTYCGPRDGHFAGAPPGTFSLKVARSRCLPATRRHCRPDRRSARRGSQPVDYQSISKTFYPENRIEGFLNILCRRHLGATRPIGYQIEFCSSFSSSSNIQDASSTSPNTSLTSSITLFSESNMSDK